MSKAASIPLSSVDRLIHRMAKKAHAEIGAMAEKARRDTNENFNALQRWLNRSIAQRRRFMVAKQLRERARK